MNIIWTTINGNEQLHRLHRIRVDYQFGFADCEDCSIDIDEWYMIIDEVGFRLELRKDKVKRIWVDGTSFDYDEFIKWLRKVSGNED